MSESPFFPPIPPLMTPQRARDIARTLKGTAHRMNELGATGEARYAERQSDWWLAYALVLDRTGSSEP